MEHEKSSSRREFLSRSTVASGAVALGMSAARRASAANEKIRLGFIGVGNRGTQLMQSFMAHDDAEIVAICDVYQPFLDRDRSKVDPDLLKVLGSRVPKLDEKFPASVARYTDFRRLIEDKNVDAVVIATPDHWHAIMAIQALEAGKDVYVEKPLSVTVHEGRKMVEAAERTGRVVQAGLHRRSSKLYAHVREQLQSGKIGKISVASAYRISNMYPDGIGKLEPQKPIPGLDWDMWLGPRAEQKYQNNILPYFFRWWQDYSSQMGNWGVHYCDAIRWMLGDEAPTMVSALGGQLALDDDRTIPDTMQATFQLPSKSLLVFGQYEASGGEPLPWGELEFRGTLGNFYTGAEAKGYRVFVPSGRGQFQTGESPLKPEEAGPMDGNLTDQHTRNFLDCVKSRAKCNCDMETGHRSTSFAHLANIALRTQSTLHWDAKNERVTNNKKANELLQYDYRKPWTLG